MKNIYAILFIWIGLIYTVQAQVLTTSPEFPKADEAITFTFDLSTTSLNNYSNDLWVWAWIYEGCSTDCDAPTNVNPATSAQDAAKLTRDGSNPNIYTITFTPTTFFNKPVEEFVTLGMLVKGQDWSNGQTSDLYVPIATDEFALTISSPPTSPYFVEPNSSFDVVANTSADATISVFVGDVMQDFAVGVQQFTYTMNVPGNGSGVIRVEATDGTTMLTEEITFIVRAATVEEPRPVGIIDGINYDSNDATKATLSLWAPLKSSVYVRGDFNDWQTNSAYQMKKDGEHFWLEINGLTAGMEYGYQYIVDEEIIIADPYADKILDPDDEYIPADIYPNLKPFPSEVRSDWHKNRVAVLQTDQAEYSWTNTSFTKPDNEDLIIYELLIRDFFGPGDHSYKNVMDTLSYLKDLGINALQLMPIHEFNGNEGWGYNPTFMFAPDKYYGSKNDLKALIDAAHGMGIAVILDITLNHHDIPNPYALMYYNTSSSQMDANSPWFNVTAKHPFNVFFDMNHESSYTQAYVDTITHYWVNEYRVDGYRFDLSKGFTQVDYGDDVGAWGAKDDSRIALLKRMADNIWSHTSDAYVILEHFADNEEEIELSNYGMMLWGNMHSGYKQSILGYESGASISGVYHGTRGWNNKHLIGYMESHDEERQGFDAKNYGSSSGDYNVRELSTAMSRLSAASTFLYLIPGPKMMWQYGEWGYDESINLCEDGTINDDCRLSNKPVPWNNVEGLDYGASSSRKALQKYIAQLLKLRSSSTLFNTSDVTFSENSLIKIVTLRNQPYTSEPTDVNDMNAVLVGNFNVDQRIVEVSFPHTGMWYNQVSQTPLQVTSTNQLVTLAAGEYAIFTDIDDQLIELVTSIDPALNFTDAKLFPNPVHQLLSVELKTNNGSISIVDLKGQEVLNQSLTHGLQVIDLSALNRGMYIYTINTITGAVQGKIVRE